MTFAARQINIDIVRTIFITAFIHAFNRFINVRKMSRSRKLLLL